ncbi:DNA-directed RNA polymerase III subunit RPC5-like [Mizuhopecten yessoensis]|uniref:DNA-directed RNA polymerase III subunit RPC5 n=1 Tax=Mizuhopecten yessoensis TaxID=6573 RepID=A0A210R4Y7_MIZYE|nr:DNA-directed RNA polymerase III subunit RPC5-like [Mizuhopecten yessoensis]OWF55981.1 DNA-directed RNA polymerase III subunit RPC5 [Mizuhopecten yessoensis]
MADEEDPVEHEVNVYLSKTLADKLYLFQYPVRPAHMTYDDAPHINTKIKPDQKKVEIELGLNTRGDNYARSKGEQIAINVDGGGDQPGYYSSGMMDKQVFSSMACSETAGRYAVGVWKDGEVHLTPLHAVVQLRPNFNYLDSADSRLKVEVGAGDTGGGESSQDEAEEEAKPVTMKFARQETDEAKARRLASYAYLQKKQEEEPWRPLQFYDINSGVAESERLKLVSSKGDEISEFQIQANEYLRALVPPLGETQEEKPAMPSNVLSLTQLRTMPLPDQIKALLTNAKVMRFSQLMALLPQGTESMGALRSLQQVAVLVQGCWVVKSEVLYPKEATSPHSGVAADHLCRGRDYVMWRFTQSSHVTRKDIASIVKLPAEDVKDILEQMSRIRANCGWEFLFAHDSDFCNRYPEIVLRQKMLWDAKYQGLCNQLKIPKEHEKKFKDRDPGVSAGEKVVRRRRSSSSRSNRKRTLSGRSVSDHSDVEMDVSLKSDIDNSTEDEEVPKHERMDTQSALNGERLSDGAKATSCDISSVSLELRAELVNFVQEKLYSRFVLTASELKRLFSIKQLQCPSGHVFLSGVTDSILEETVKEVGGVKLSNQWPSNTKAEPIYALPKTGDKLDKMRSILLGLFEKSHKISRKAFLQCVEDETGLQLNEYDARLLLKDYCVQKGPLWYLKGTQGES